MFSGEIRSIFSCFFGRRLPWFFPKGFGSMFFLWTLDFGVGFFKDYWDCKNALLKNCGKKTNTFILKSSH